jgi:hypothetical protein
MGNGGRIVESWTNLVRIGIAVRPPIERKKMSLSPRSPRVRLESLTIKELIEKYKEVRPDEDIENLKMKKQQWVERVRNALLARRDVLVVQIEAGCSAIPLP